MAPECLQQTRNPRILLHLGPPPSRRPILQKLRWAGGPVPPSSPGSLGRACPAPRLCSRGAAWGSSPAAVTQAPRQQPGRSGSAAAPSRPAPWFAPAPAALPLRLPQLRGGRAGRAARAPPAPGRDLGGGASRGGGERGGRGPQRAAGGCGDPASGPPGAPGASPAAGGARVRAATEHAPGGRGSGGRGGGGGARAGRRQPPPPTVDIRSAPRREPGRRRPSRSVGPGWVWAPQPGVATGVRGGTERGSGRVL